MTHAEACPCQDCRRTREVSEAEALAARGQARHAELTGTPSTRDEGVAISQAFSDWVARLPRVSMQDGAVADAFAHQLAALVQSVPVADTSGPWFSYRSHHALRGQ